MGVDRREDAGTRSRVDNALEVAAREAAKSAARKTARRAALGYFLLLLVLFAGAALYQRATNGRLDRSEFRACERLQSQRERTNVSEARQFLLLRAVATSSRASTAVKVRYEALARTTLYDPPTLCGEAVRRPNSYRRPVSRPFYSLPRAYTDAVVEAAKNKRPQPTP